mgnify:CR=1
MKLHHIIFVYLIRCLNCNKHRSRQRLLSINAAASTNEYSVILYMNFTKRITLICTFPECLFERSCNAEVMKEFGDSKEN